MDKFTGYVKDNPNTSYDDAAKAMRRSPKTIYRWCKKLGIRLTTPKTDDRLGATLPSTTKKEEESLDELDRIADEINRQKAHLQKRIDELQNQIEEIEEELYIDELQKRLEDVCRRVQGNAGHQG